MRALHAVLLAALSTSATTAYGQTEPQPNPDTQPPLLSAQVREHAKGSPTAPDDPYPIQAAGWGPPAGQRFFVERWAEDWSKLKAQDKAPPLKAMPVVGDDITLTLSTEERMRVDAYSNGGLYQDNNFHQFETRVIVGADLRVGKHFRIYGELGDAQFSGQSSVFTPNFKGTAVPGNYRNDLAVQQLFAEARTEVGGYLVGVIAGRQEFLDGPRQIISLSEGPNLHRTWNGVRLYLHGPRFRLGAFSFKVTAPGLGSFDDGVNQNERLKGVNASVALLPPGGGLGDLFLEPFWFHTYNIKGAAGPTSGPDRRDTYGARLWGTHGPLQIDWTGFRQTGDHAGREVDAWAASFIQNVVVYNKGVRVRVGGHIDLASGGNSFSTTGPVHSFNQLYASVSYFGQGLLLSQSNLLMFAPAIAVAPARNVTINMDYAFLRRQNENDAVYSGLMRPYAGTQNVPGRDVGTYARMVGSWAINRNFSIDIEGEHLFAGNVLKRAGFPHGGSYGMMSLTFRY